MSISEQITKIIQTQTDNNNPPQVITIRKAYNNNTADIETENGTLYNIPCSGTPIDGTQGLLTYNNGDINQPYIILFEDAKTTIQAMGYGEFHINTDGDLILELPNGTPNIFTITDGKLTVTDDPNYEIIDKNIYYNREVIT